MEWTINLSEFILQFLTLYLKNNTMEFTKTQLDAISAFKSFLKDDEQVFMLKGAAGTGKTTLVSEFIKILDSEKESIV